MKSLSLKLSVAAVALAGIAASSNVAFAGDIGDMFSATVSVVSDYRFRGVTQNDKDVTPEAGITWTDEGFYLGTWSAKTNWDAGAKNSPSYEVDFFGGKHFDLGGTDLNVEAYYYSYPDYNKDAFGTKRASFYETLVQLTHTFGPLTVTATGANSPQWSLGGGVSWYGSGGVSYAVTDWMSLVGTVGYQYVKKAPDSYAHWDLGTVLTWKNFSLDMRYVDTNISKADCAGFWMATPHACNAGFVANLTYNITKLF
jgi:uncharacterized protein (TIGR02001 family)